MNRWPMQRLKMPPLVAARRFGSDAICDASTEMAYSPGKPESRAWLRLEFNPLILFTYALGGRRDAKRDALFPAPLGDDIVMLGRIGVWLGGMSGVVEGRWRRLVQPAASGVRARRLSRRNTRDFGRQPKGKSARPMSRGGAAAAIERTARAATGGGWRSRTRTPAATARRAGEVRGANQG